MPDRSRFKIIFKKQAFHDEKRKVGAVSLEAFSDRMAFEQETINFGPVNNVIDQVHSLDGPVFPKELKIQICNDLL